MIKIKNKKPTANSKYVQQHLANERTYLAWIRTAIATIGIGYVATKFHFFAQVTPGPYSDFFARVIGILAGIVSIAIIIYATVSYLVKRKGINEQTFISPFHSVLIFSCGVAVLSLLLLTYMLLI